MRFFKSHNYGSWSVLEEAKLGSDAAKLIGDDSISDVENTVLALKIRNQICNTLKYSNRLPRIIALSRTIASFWYEENNNRPRP